MNSSTALSPDAPSPNTTPTVAPLWRRLAAIIYDGLIVIAISMAYSAITLALDVAIFGAPERDYQPTLGGWIYQLGWLAAVAFFYCYFWHRNGQTLGMRAWRLQVLDDDYQPMTWKRCLLRCAASWLTVFTLGAGYLWTLIDRQQASLHDRLSRSRVILLPKNR